MSTAQYLTSRLPQPVSTAQYHSSDAPLFIPQGNAEIWAVLDEMQSRRVLKITEEDSVQEEVAARQALGWDYHGLTVLKVNASDDL